LVWFYSAGLIAGIIVDFTTSMKKIFFILILVTAFVRTSMSQENTGIVVMAKITDTDTIITQNLPEFCIIARMPWKIKSELKSQSKLIYNVKKVYPYAKLAGIKLNEYEVLLISAADDKERKKLMKQAEDELRDEFEEDIKKLTYKQGIILIKLVDRETGNSSYALIQELRGKFTAFFWQTFAKLFGYNLKEEYDPTGNDKEIEDIVLMIENGQI
jgi:hypothetical protein